MAHTVDGMSEPVRAHTGGDMHGVYTLSGECAETNQHSLMPVHVSCRVLDCEGSKTEITAAGESLMEGAPP